MERIFALIDAATAPDRMSKQAAVEFLEQIIADLEPRIEALKEEIEAEE